MKRIPIAFVVVARYCIALLMVLASIVVFAFAPFLGMLFDAPEAKYNIFLYVIMYGGVLLGPSLIIGAVMLTRKNYKPLLIPLVNIVIVGSAFIALDVYCDGKAVCDLFQ